MSRNLVEMLSLVLLVLAQFLTPVQIRAAETPGADLALRTADALYAGIQTKVLANGLHVYLKPIPGSTSVTTMLVFKVGSADEDKAVTGLSHYLEHLMFKGTARLKPGDIDRVTFRAGGSNNAYTSSDLTAYHFTLPAGRWKSALEIEADRMRNLVIDKAHEFDKEKGAVINELTGNEDSAWDLEFKAILPLLFGKKHPYGHPVIGEEKHVRDATEAIIKNHYDRWYQPNNASLILVGGFNADEAMATIEKLFSTIPGSPLPPRNPLPSEPVKLPARTEMPSKFSVARLLLGFPTVTAGDPDRPALDVLEAILGQGKRSRLYRHLVEGSALASAASADHTAGRYPGWMAIAVELLPGKDRAATEKILLAELAKVRDEAVTPAELRRVQQQLLSRTIFKQESTYGLADRIGQAVTLTDLDSARKYLPRLLAVTPADVQRVARKYLTPDRCATLWSVPGAKGGARLLERQACPLHGRKLARSMREPGASAGAFDLRKAERIELPGGLVLLLFENHRLPIFEVHVSLREAALYQSDDKLGVADLTGSLLDEGTRYRTSAEIAEAIESVGGAMALAGSGAQVKVLAPDQDLALTLLFESLLEPAFGKEEFGRARARLLAELGEAEVQPETRAQRAYNAAIYGKSPLGRPSSGTLTTVRGLTVEDCKTFHQKVYVPGNTVVAVVGDFDSKKIRAAIEKRTAAWKKVPPPRLPELPRVELPARFSQTILTMPDAAQLQVFMGHIGITRSNPDYYKLLVMDHILGTGPGFSDRMSARLRDREGLAYTVQAAITSSAGLHSGTFTCYIGTDNANLERVKTLFLEELNRIRDTLPSADEVSETRAYLIGSRLLQFGQLSGIARQLLAVERYGLGFGYLEEFQTSIAGVTAADVQAVAKKHLHPTRMVLIAAGAVDSTGKPLSKASK